MKNFAILTFALLLITSCSPSEEQMVNAINGLQEVMKNDDIVAPEKVDEMISLYGDYIQNYPEGEQATNYLEMQAKYLTIKGETEQAIANYDKIYSDYPNAPNRASALFMKAFLHEVNLQDLDKAEELYKQFITEFPNDDFVDDAQFSIEHMRMSPEELLEFFKSKQAVKDSTDTPSEIQ